MDMGKTMIKAMTKPIDLTSFEDEYGKALADMIAAKMTGQELAPVPAPKKSGDGDLVEQLMASLKALEPA
jgi:non-homologous end joining protein Ku